MEQKTVLHEGKNLRMRISKKQEEALKEETPVHIEDTRSGLLRIDEEYTIRWASENISTILGTASNEILGKKCYEILGYGRKPSSCSPLASLKSKSSVASVTHVPHLDKWLLIEVFGDFDARGKIKGMISHICDVTKGKERQLYEINRMSGLVNTAAAIAHEINNPLAAVRINLERLIMETKDKKLVKDYTKMVTLIEKVSDITGTLLNFSKKRPPEFKNEDINAILDQALTIVSNRFLLENKQIIKQYTKSLPQIKADSNQLQRAFVNLAINALEALDQKGTLFIITRNMSQIRHVKITFKDNGCGITRVNLGKVFNPFFTTKESGIGLGLTIIRQIIKQHGGAVEINSAPGRGSRVNVFLPSVLE